MTCPRRVQPNRIGPRILWMWLMQLGGCMVFYLSKNWKEWTTRCVSHNFTGAALQVNLRQRSLAECKRLLYKNFLRIFFKTCPSCRLRRKAPSPNPLSMHFQHQTVKKFKICTKNWPKRTAASFYPWFHDSKLSGNHLGLPTPFRDSCLLVLIQALWGIFRCHHGGMRAHFINNNNHNWYESVFICKTPYFI